MKGRKKTKVELLLEALSDGDWHWGDELALPEKVGWRFGDAKHKAQQQGYLIETDRVGLKHRYRWIKV